MTQCSDHSPCFVIASFSIHRWFCCFGFAFLLRLSIGDAILMAAQTSNSENILSTDFQIEKNKYKWYTEELCHSRNVKWEWTVGKQRWKKWKWKIEILCVCVCVRAIEFLCFVTFCVIREKSLLFCCLSVFLSFTVPFMLFKDKFAVDLISLFGALATKHLKQRQERDEQDDTLLKL